MIMTNEITLRRGGPEDARHFSQLVIMTSPVLYPALFGSDVQRLMKRIFRYKKHYYSFDNSFFVDVNGKTAGMALMQEHTPKMKEKIRFSLILMKYMRWRFLSIAFNLIKSERVVKKAAKDAYYLSNIAVYPEFRSLGLGSKLLSAIEEKAKSVGIKRITLNTRTHNTRAINFYEKLGYKIENRLPVLRIRDKEFESFKICKQLS
jgi:ribosomal protein S18 acetylase RimI-like enzyme